MHIQDQVRDALFSAVDDVNELLPKDARLARSDATPLAGPDAQLDSIGLVNFIAAAEQQIEARFGAALNLFDEGLFDEEAPLATVGTLADLIVSRLRERTHA